MASTRSALVGLTLLLATAGGLAVAAPSGTIAGRTGRSAHVNYMVECQGCHLPQGVGMPGKVPVMKGVIHRFLEVEGGREFLVQVPGVSNSRLNDADVADLLNWSIETMGPARPGDFKPYTADEVTRYRAHRLADVPGTRAALMRRIEALSATGK